MANMETSLSYRKLTPSLNAINAYTCIIISISSALRVTCACANEATACVYSLPAIPNELSFIKVVTYDIIIATSALDIRGASSYHKPNSFRGFLHSRAFRLHGIVIITSYQIIKVFQNLKIAAVSFFV